MKPVDSGDEQLWEACRRLPSDWEPHGQRKWHGRREARPDCDTCRWFVGLFRTSPDWGVCANPESGRAGLLTFREQGRWQHEPEEERRYQAAHPARCDFVRRFEPFLREQAAAFIKEQVHRANDPSPDDELPAPAPEQLRQAPPFAVIRRVLRHADEDFRRRAFDAMTARARRDARRYWEFAGRCWARTLGEDLSAIRLPDNMRELENAFWQRVDAAITEALKGRGPKPAEKRQRRAG
jgi:hypothetical protein